MKYPLLLFCLFLFVPLASAQNSEPDDLIVCDTYEILETELTCCGIEIGVFTQLTRVSYMGDWGFPHCTQRSENPVHCGGYVEYCFEDPQPTKWPKGCRLDSCELVECTQPRPLDFSNEILTPATM